MMTLSYLLTQTMAFSPSSFVDEIVVVTGAGQGIGLQTARAFALLGARVVLAEISPKGTVVEAQIKADGGQALFVPADVSDPLAVQFLLEQTRQCFGPATILINNAIVIQESSVLEMPLDVWDQTIAVNLRGTFLCCQAFLPDMLANRRGTILNMVSTDAMPGLAAYIASKQGIVGFSQSLDLELNATGVRVIPFAPGMVDTPGIRSIANGLAPRLGLSVDQFLGLSLHAEYSGLMPAEHAAAAAVYLAANLVDEFHGQVVNGYEVLERAGVLRTAENDFLVQESPAASFSLEVGNLLQQLSLILQDTEAEINQLPIFARPLARQGFKRKSGRSIPDWQRLIHSIETAGDLPSEHFSISLQKLASYYREVPKETARFTRDHETLKQVVELCTGRIDIIERFGKYLN
jgi:NAD(P)-dependent dehydrogenase (short-subunit alcohol dehydrogenase family)